MTKGCACNPTMCIHAHMPYTNTHVHMHAQPQVLEKDITCGPSNLPSGPSMPAMPSCLPQYRNGSKTEDKNKENAASDEAQEEQVEDKSEQSEKSAEAEKKKSASASSFWNRWSGR